MRSTVGGVDRLRERIATGNGVERREKGVAAGVPSPTLEVIGAGLGRTGTLSLHAALERLGFAPCEHMTNCFAHPERFALWLEAARRKRAGEPIDWRPLFTGYRATVDWPGAYFWRELTAAHPEAKVILTVRDPAALVRQRPRHDLRGNAGAHRRRPRLDSSTGW